MAKISVEPRAGFRGELSELQPRGPHKFEALTVKKYIFFTLRTGKWKIGEQKKTSLQKNFVLRRWPCLSMYKGPPQGTPSGATTYLNLTLVVERLIIV